MLVSQKIPPIFTKALFIRSQSNAWMGNITLIFNRARDKMISRERWKHAQSVDRELNKNSLFATLCWWLLTQSDNTPHKIIRVQNLIFLYLTDGHKNGKMWHLIYQLLRNSILYQNAKIELRGNLKFFKNYCLSYK